MKKFSFYEFTGIIVPGVVACLAIYHYLAPTENFAIYLLISAQNNFGGGSFSVGNFGFFLVFSYIVGHLIQSLGNWFESFYWWCRSGKPTDWIRQKEREGIKFSSLAVDREQLQFAVRKQELLPKDQEMSKVSEHEWKVLVSRMRSIIFRKNRAERMEIFNANYGMFRGLTVSILLAFVLLLLEKSSVKVLLILFISGGLAMCRMHRFSKYYAEALFTEFIQIAHEEERGETDQANLQ